MTRSSDLYDSTQEDNASYAWALMSIIFLNTFTLQLHKIDGAEVKSPQLVYLYSLLLIQNQQGSAGMT